MTTKHVVADDALGLIARRYWEVRQRVMEGTLDAYEVARALQIIVEGSLPTEMTIAGRTYEILSPLRENEDVVIGPIMEERAKAMKAHLGEDDGQHLLDHQEEIPEDLRGSVVFVFTDWRDPDHSEHVVSVFGHGGRWVREWRWLAYGFHRHIRLLRRKPTKAAEESLPTEMTIAGRTYEILGFLQGDEESVVGFTMVNRAKELNANLGKEDCQHLLDHQKEIPKALRGKVAFVFPDWRGPDNPDYLAFVNWDGSRWIQYWTLLDGASDALARVLRLK